MQAGSSLYVQGGKLTSNNQIVSTSSQLFALDLAMSWSTDVPHWKPLTNGPTVNLHVGIATADNETLITFQSSNDAFNVNKYSISRNSWETTVVPASSELLQAIRAVRDPLSGLVYINGQQNMNIYNPVTNGLQLEPIPPNVFSARFFSGAVYNSARGSIMYMGGLTTALGYEASTYITEYTIATKTWAIFVSKDGIRGLKCELCTRFGVLNKQVQQICFEAT